MIKNLVTLLLVFSPCFLLAQVNFSDETDGKNYRIEYRAVAGNDLSRLRSYFEDTVFSKSGLLQFLRNDSRKGNTVILFRVLRKKDATGEIQKIEFYTTQSGTMLFKNQVILMLPADKAQIDFIEKIYLLQL
jgi:hypothetical protein